jgi:hypothetical protein
MLFARARQMERRLWNEPKIKVLSVLNDNSGLTSRGVSTALGISVPCAGMVLLSMHRQRLVDRTRPGLWHIFKKPPYQYSINDRGHARLNYLSQRPLSYAVKNTAQGDQQCAKGKKMRNSTSACWLKNRDRRLFCANTNLLNQNLGKLINIILKTQS